MSQTFVFEVSCLNETAQHFMAELNSVIAERLWKTNLFLVASREAKRLQNKTVGFVCTHALFGAYVGHTCFDFRYNPSFDF